MSGIRAGVLNRRQVGDFWYRFTCSLSMITEQTTFVVGLSSEGWSWYLMIFSLALFGLPSEINPLWLSLQKPQIEFSNMDKKKT